MTSHGLLPHTKLDVHVYTCTILYMLLTCLVLTYCVHVGASIGLLISNEETESGKSLSCTNKPRPSINRQSTCKLVLGVTHSSPSNTEGLGNRSHYTLLAMNIPIILLANLFGKAQWCIYTCMYSTTIPDVPG